jgi:hypothetical protein
MSPKELTAQWIEYLKSSGIANKQSAPDGRLNYLRKVTVPDLSKFLEIHGDFNPVVIKKAISSVLANKKPGTAVATQQQPQQGAGNQQQPTNNPAIQGPAAQPTPAPKKFNTDDAEDIEPHEPTQQQQPQKPRVKPVGRDASGKMRYKPVNEDIRDVGQPDLDEDDVENVFKLLLNPPKQQPKPKQGSKYPFKNAKTPAVSGDEAKAQELEQLKEFISKKMNSTQRKMLWDLLQPSTVAEAFASSDDASKIFAAISKMHSNTGNLDIEDLKRAWQKAHSPDTVAEIKQLLQHLGYDDKSIDQAIYSSVGPQSDDDEEEDDSGQNQVDEAVKKIADYIKQAGITNEVVEFMQKHFAEDISPKPGMFQKMKNFGNKMFGRKATTEEIKRIFVNILKEDRKCLPEIQRLVEASNLGRSRKK